MLDRRYLLASGLSLVSAAIGKTSVAADFQDDPLPPLPPELVGFHNEEDYFSTTLDYQTLGTAKPTPEEIATAQMIMASAPFNTTPLAVAQWYRALGLGKCRVAAQSVECSLLMEKSATDDLSIKSGEDIRPYARGWPRKYNPIIIEMFKSCLMNPLAPGGQGDATAWCAAFVNYCIARAASKSGAIGKAEIALGTQSASSGSFRCWGKGRKEHEDPVVGDIVVWALDGTVHGCAIGKGHVGFYIGPSNDPKRPYVVLGGNSSAGILEGTETRKDGIIQKAFPVNFSVSGGTNTLFSFRYV